MVHAITVNGAWSSWGEYSFCSATCEAGTMHRRRTCTNPSPSNGGTTCAGNSMKSTRCNLGACPGE